MPANSNALTPRQFDCLRAIAKHQAEHGRSPTMRELAAYLGVRSHSTSYFFIERLGAKGYIERDGRLSRTIVILEAGRKALEETK